MSELGSTTILKKKLPTLRANNPAISSGKIDQGISVAAHPDGKLKISAEGALSKMQIGRSLRKPKTNDENVKLGY